MEMKKKKNNNNNNVIIGLVRIRIIFERILPHKALRIRTKQQQQQQQQQYNSKDREERVKRFATLGFS